MTLNIIVSEARTLRSGVSTKVKDDKASWCDNDADTGTVHLKTVCAAHKTTSRLERFQMQQQLPDHFRTPEQLFLR